MWKNKTSFVVRKCDDKNIMKTRECGIYEKYEKEVSTVSQEQQKIRLMLDDPSSKIKIGMDAQQTQSVSSSMLIRGTKVKTQTISFRTSFEDLPPYMESNALEKKPFYEPNDDEDSFEHKFCAWILHRIESREQSTPYSDTVKMKGGSSTSDLVEKIFDYYLGSSESDRNKIATDCTVFVRDLGITHYVSSIEMGAISYQTASVSSKQKKIGAGAEVEVGSYASGGLSGFTERLWFQSHKEERMIGKITNKKVAEEDEAVIGFQIQPIYSLAPVPYLQPALSKAVKEYIQRKADPTGEL